MVPWKDFANAAPELAQAGSALLNQFGVGLAFLATVRPDGGPRLHPVCPVVAGRARLIEDPATRAAVLRDARHMADASETLFEMWIERVMHTRWENVPTPEMRSSHQTWRAPS